MAGTGKYFHWRQRNCLHLNLGFFKACQSSSNSIQRNDREQLLDSSFNINSRGSLDYDSLNNDVVVTIVAVLYFIRKLDATTFSISDRYRCYRVRAHVNRTEFLPEKGKIVVHYLLDGRANNLSFWIVSASLCEYSWYCGTKTDNSRFIRMQYLVWSFANIVGCRPTSNWIHSSMLYRFQVWFFVDFLTTFFGIQKVFTCRRDRGVTSQNVMITFDTSHLSENRTASAFGETIFVFVVPSLLHFIGFLSAIYVLRIADNEQLQNLVERVGNIRRYNFCYFNVDFLFRFSYCASIRTDYS